MTASNQIVTLNVSQTVAPAPSTLQQTGALLSHGGTTTSQYTTTLLTQLSDLTPILATVSSTVGLASISQAAGTATGTLESTTIASGAYNNSTGVVTLTLTASIGVGVGANVTVSSSTGTGSNAAIEGTWVTISGTSGTTLKYTIATGLTMTITGGNIASVLIAATGSEFTVTVSGSAPTAYNGTFVATVASASTFTYQVPVGTSSPATGTPVFKFDQPSELLAMATTFFAQGNTASIYVLELGSGTPAAQVSALSTYIGNNPIFYAYLVPRAWASEPTFLTFVTGYESDTSKTYFLTTMDLTNYTSFTSAMKCVIGLVEAPLVPGTEFSLAAELYWIVNQVPSITNKVTPNAFIFTFGTTPYPTFGNGATLTALKNAGVNYIGTGAAGGISDTILYWGTSMDKRDFSYWYSVDWVQINVQLDLTAAIIEGSNNPQNPLYYDQNGINRLQATSQGTMNRGIGNGLVLAPATVTAVDFITYITANPSDFAAGAYNGLAVVYTPNRGFKSIVFNVQVSDIPQA